jgi:N4-gp56 family major capsid protein
LTGPVRDAFLALGHTKLSKDLNNLQGFLPKWNYPSSLKTVSSEWGSVNNVRILLSSVGSVDAASSSLGNDIYNIFVMGLESLGIVEQDNFTSRFLYRPPVFSDPLFQNVTLGTVFAQVPRILNDLWLTKMTCTLR